MIYFLRNHYPAEFRSFVLMWRETTPADGSRARHILAATLSGLSLIGILFLS